MPPSSLVEALAERRPLTARPLRLLVAGTLTLGLLGGCSSRSTVCPADALQARALSDLRDFADWLRVHDAEGFVGEVGWPGDRDPARWNRLGEAWLTQADAEDLSVSVWAAGEWWPPDYPLAVYRSAPGSPSSALNIAGPQAPVVERHLDGGGALRGVADGSGSFGTGAQGYSAQQPGVYGQDYSYPGRTSLEFLAARGVRVLRLAFTWERVQPRLDAALDPAELARLVEVVRTAEDAGLGVVLDLHSYARYRPTAGQELVLGSDALPASSLADVWRRLATAMSRQQGVVGYGLMNEPHDLPGDRGGAGTWERAAQLTVDAIRRVDRTTPVMVAGASWSRLADWSTRHPRPWVEDPAGRVVYEAHQYFDQDASGTYARGYSEELAAARDEAPTGTNGASLPDSCG